MLDLEEGSDLTELTIINERQLSSKLKQVIAGNVKELLNNVIFSVTMVRQPATSPADSARLVVLLKVSASIGDIAVEVIVDSINAMEGNAVTIRGKDVMGIPTVRFASASLSSTTNDPFRPTNCLKPPKFCAGGEYDDPFDCDGDGFIDHVCRTSTEVQVASSSWTQCSIKRGQLWQLHSGYPFCDTDLLWNNIIPSRKFKQVPSTQSCPEQYTEPASCDVCKSAVEALQKDTTIVDCNGEGNKETPFIIVTPRCLLNTLTSTGTYSKNGTFATEDTDVSEEELLDKFPHQVCLGVKSGCTDEDTRLNKEGCQPETQFTGIYIFVSCGVFLGIVFFMRRASASDSSNSTMSVKMEITTIICILDIVSDVSYFFFETFAFDELHRIAAILLLVPLAAPVLYFFFVGYNLMPMSELKKRGKTAVKIGSTVWSGMFNNLGFWSRVLLSVISIGGYPVVVAILATFVATLVGLLSLAVVPVEILLSFLAIGLAKGWENTKILFVILVGNNDHRGICKIMFENETISFAGALIIIAIGPATVVIVWSLSIVGSLAYAFLMPIIFGVFVVLRIFILFPKLWGALRSTLHHLLVYYEDGIMHWTKYKVGLDETESVENGPALLTFGPVAESSRGHHLLFQIWFLQSAVLFEFILETIPQLGIQAYNNALRSSWTPFAITSFVISVAVTIDMIYTFAFKRFYRRIPFGHPRMVGIEDSDLIALFEKENTSSSGPAWKQVSLLRDDIYFDVQPHVAPNNPMHMPAWDRIGLGVEFQDDI
jgi:hypothetical protein